MNGELKELYNEIDKRLSSLEAVLEERWHNHANREDKVEKHIEGIFNKFDRLNCKAHFEKMNTNRVLLLMVLGGLLGLTWKVLM